MMGLLVFKEGLKAFYAKYSAFVIPAIRFAVGFTAVLLMNQNVGFMPKLSGPLIPAGMGLVCACLPYGAIAFLCGVFLLAQLSAASLEVTVIALVFILVVALLYYSFRPGDSVLLLAAPILFFLKMPFVIPLLTGLAGSLLSVIPMCCGIFIYYVMMYTKMNSSFLAGSGQEEITQVFIGAVKGLWGNQAMLVMMAACCLGVLAVHLIKRWSVSYSWIIAIAAGVIVQVVVIFVGDFRFGVEMSLPEMTVGILLSCAAAGAYHFFVFAVDYSRTEYVQFEDDEYYYYVKAVPKLTVTRPDVKVKRINTRKAARR